MVSKRGLPEEVEAVGLLRPPDVPDGGAATADPVDVGSGSEVVVVGGFRDAGAEADAAAAAVSVDEAAPLADAPLGGDASCNGVIHIPESDASIVGCAHEPDVALALADAALEPGSELSASACDAEERDPARGEAREPESEVVESVADLVDRDADVANGDARDPESEVFVSARDAAERDPARGEAREPESEVVESAVGKGDRAGVVLAMGRDPGGNVADWEPDFGDVFDNGSEALGSGVTAADFEAVVAEPGEAGVVAFDGDGFELASGVAGEAPRAGEAGLELADFEALPAADGMPKPAGDPGFFVSGEEEAEPAAPGALACTALEVAVGVPRPDAAACGVAPDVGAAAPPAAESVSNGPSGSNNSSSPSRSSESCSKGALEDTPADGLASGAEAAASFRASSNRSESPGSSRLSGSINSSVGPSGLVTDPALRGEAAEDWDVAPVGTLPSIGASTGRSASGSKTGRDAASIVSSLVNASSNAIELPPDASWANLVTAPEKPSRAATAPWSGSRSPSQMTLRRI